jgi:plastocyanin domain-containing protein
MSVAQVLSKFPRRRGVEDGATLVRVRGVFQPNILFGRVGEPLRIVFRREETAACSERVIFPAFGRSAALPAFQDVTVELHPEEPGEYEFTGQLDLLKGRLRIFPARSTDCDRRRK